MNFGCLGKTLTKLTNEVNLNLLHVVGPTSDIHRLSALENELVYM